MNPAPNIWMCRLAAVAGWAYRSLLLTFLLIALAQLASGNGVWFNEAMVAAVLALPLAVLRLSRTRKAAGRVA